MERKRRRKERLCALALAALLSLNGALPNVTMAADGTGQNEVLSGQGDVSDDNADEKGRTIQTQEGDGIDDVKIGGNNTDAGSNVENAGNSVVNNVNTVPDSGSDDVDGKNNDADAGSNTAGTGNGDGNAGSDAAGTGSGDADAGSNDTGTGNGDADAGSNDTGTGNGDANTGSDDTNGGNPDGDAGNNDASGGDQGSNDNSNAAGASPIELELSDLTAQVTWSLPDDEQTKIYDGEKGLYLVGDLKGDALNNAIESGDVVKIKVPATLSGADAGSYGEATIRLKNEDGGAIDFNTCIEGEQAIKDKYTIKNSIDTTTSTDVTVTLDGGRQYVISPRPVYVTAGDVGDVQYGTFDDMQKAVGDKGTIILAGTDGKISTATDAKEGVLAVDKGNVESAIVGKAKAELVAPSEPYYVGEYLHVVKAVLNDANDAAVGNYEVSVATENSFFGKLTVTQQTMDSNTLKDVVELDESESEKIYVDGNGKIWVQDGGRIVFKLKNTNTNGLYDKVQVKKKGGSSFEDYIQFGSSADEKEINELEMCLVNTNGGENTRTQSAAYAVSIEVDDEAPTVTFSGQLGSGLIKWLDFLNKDTVWRRNVTIEDLKSGLKGDQYYKIYRVEEGELMTATYESIEKAAENSSDWEMFGNSAGGEVIIPKSGKNHKSGYYVILVKVRDNAGNHKVWCSNGMVIDLREPEIDDIVLSELEEGKKIYRGDVGYSFTIKDAWENDKVTSGIASVEALVKINGSNEEECIQKWGKDELLEAVKKEMIESGESYQPEEGTYEWLQNMASVTLNGKIQAERFNSNDVTLIIRAKDGAGNELASKEKKLQIDVTDPRVEVFYDDDSSGAMYGAECVMYVEYTERNFDEGLATFKIDKKVFSTEDQGGREESYEIDLKTLVHGGIEGIQAELESDTDEGKITVDETVISSDKRKIRYKITLGTAEQDIDFEITPFVEDLAGGKGDVEKQKFTVDMLAPAVQASYNDAEIGGVKNGKYYNRQREMTITYTERNFDISRVCFDIIVDGTVKSGVSYDKLCALVGLDGELRDAGIQVGIKEAAEGAANEHKVVITFGKEGADHDYRIEPSITDLAGNVNAGHTDVTTEGVPTGQDFTVDMLAPAIQVSYNDAEIGGVKNGKYYNKQRKMTITYTERHFVESEVKFVVIVDGEKIEFSYTELYGDNADESKKKLLENADIQVGTMEMADGAANQYEVVITFGKKGADHDYRIAPSITDLVGNRTEMVTDKEGAKVPTGSDFTVDMLVPVMKVTFGLYNAESDTFIRDVTDEIAMKPQDEMYQSQNIKATVEITERNFASKEVFDISEMSVIETAKNVDGQDMALTASQARKTAAETVAGWKPVNEDGAGNTTRTRSQTFTFTDDANYTFHMSYTDMAGNTVCIAGNPSCTGGKQANEPKEGYYFTIDKTRPTGSVKVTAQPQVYNDQAEWIWNEFDLYNPKLYFGIFDKNKVTVSWETKDAVAGMASVGYYKYTPKQEANNSFSALSWDDLEKMETSAWTTVNAAGSIVLDMEQQAVIYVRMVDKSGNVNYINTREGIIIDHTKPQAPEITITISEPEQGIYNRDVNYNITVTDPASGGTYAGLREVSYEVTNNGVKTQSGNYNAELLDPKKRVRRISHDEVVIAENNNGNHVTITVTARDYAGNVQTATKDLMIDVTAPEVWITYDLNEPANNRYYNAVRTATVHVKERNFDVNAVNFTITNTDGTMPAVGNWNISPQAGESDEAENTCTVTFAADGDYTIAMNCVDKAGNVSAPYQLQAGDDFTIDRTVPVIEVSYDNNDAANGTYYKEPRTATITVNEHNFNGSEVQTAIAAALQSQGITPPPVNGWTNNGDIHTASVRFDSDGDYSFTINYNDLAGNPAVEYSQSQFTIDQTIPQIEIFDIVDKSANNGVVAPGVNYSDVNYTPEGVHITLRGARHAQAGLDGARTATANGESIKMSDFAYEEAVDDVYVLTAQVTDLAGNMDEKSVTFSVNRFGSNFILSDETKSYVDSYYSNHETDLIVTEINVDTLEHRGITYGLDGELVALAEGEDYNVKESGGEASWKQYQYTIYAENFEREGRYNVTIDSVDRAANEVNNKIKNTNIEFVIDKTKPTVVITGVENDGQYRTNTRDITVAVEDNVEMGSVELYLDGVRVDDGSYDGENIRKQNGKIPFTLDNSSDWQSLRAVATDAAGNTADTEEIRVLVTANFFVQYYRNTPLLVGSIIVLLAIIGGMGFVIIKRRRKAEEQK